MQRAAILNSENEKSSPRDFRDLVGPEPGNSIMEWVYYAISIGLPLAVGKCKIGDGDAAETLVSLFTFDPAEG